MSEKSTQTRENPVFGHNVLLPYEKIKFKLGPIFLLSLGFRIGSYGSGLNLWEMII